MERQLDKIEFEWWASFVGHVTVLFFFICLIILLVYIYPFAIHTPMFFPFGIFVFIAFFILSLMISVLNLLHLICIFSVPKLLIFKENSIVLVNSLNRSRTFSYDSINRLIIYVSPKSGKPSKWFLNKYTQFGARMFFSDGTFKILFNPSHLSNFSALLDTLRIKGLSSVIEEYS
jgi:hypothetical protein